MERSATILRYMGTINSGAKVDTIIQIDLSPSTLKKKMGVTFRLPSDAKPGKPCSSPLVTERL